MTIAQDIIKSVADRYSVSISEIKSKKYCKDVDISNARILICKILHNDLGLSNAAIGRMLGGRTLWTVIHYWQSQEVTHKNKGGVPRKQPKPQRAEMKVGPTSQCDHCGRFSNTYIKKPQGEVYCSKKCLDEA